MYDKLKDHPELQEFLSAVITLKLCVTLGGKLAVCAKRMKHRYTDTNTLKFLDRVNKRRLEHVYNEFVASIN